MARTFFNRHCNDLSYESRDKWFCRYALLIAKSITDFWKEHQLLLHSATAYWFTGVNMTGSSENHKLETTPGEELYLVHLRRMREEEDDHDCLPRKRRSLSVGEELWEIHRRRSQGVEDDLDSENTLQGTQSIDNKNNGSKEALPSEEKKALLPKRRYNLRSADTTTKNSRE